MKIYVVTKGEYSDYHICCATIDKNQAERAAKIYSDKWDEAYIEEFDSDDILKIPDAIKKYCVSFSKTTGIVLNVYESSNEILPINSSPLIHQFLNSHYIVEVNAIDKDHALKIASDAFAKYMAEKEGL